MGRKNEGKTDTIKQRRIAVYVDDIKTKERWVSEAKKHGEPKISKFIRTAVEFYIDYMSSNRDSELEELARLRKENESLKKTKKFLLRENEKLNRLVNNMESDLKLCRKQLMSEWDIKSISPKLISILKGGPVSTEEILRFMGVEPGDAEQVSLITTQLDILLSTQIIKYDGKVWIWLL